MIATSESYRSLVLRRKECRKCDPELTNPAAFHLACWDSDEIGPWSRWLGARPAEIMLVGQDWGTTKYFEEHNGVDVSDNLTNKRLVKFLSLLGANASLPGTEPGSCSNVFATNAILCLKSGATMSAPVKARWFQACSPFLKETFEIAMPRIVICLGRHAYKAFCRAAGKLPLEFRPSVDEAKLITLPNGTVVFPVFHPAARPKDRTLPQQEEDWRRIASVCNSLGLLAPTSSGRSSQLSTIS